MALDGAFLSRVCHEISEVAIGSKVDKIAMPSREEIILHLRWRGGGEKLILSANAGSARMHFTKSSPENPKTPPMFCMLLRKHLSSAKLLAVRQIQLDRIVHLDFETRNELGDIVTVTVAVEIMGRHSNIIIMDGGGKILDSIKRIDLETSSVRQVLPGMTYALPPMQDKLNLFNTDTDKIMRALERANPAELPKALMDIMQGVSPLVCREISHFTCRGMDAKSSEMTDEYKDRLAFYLDNFINIIKTHGGTPTMVIEHDGKPRDFSFIAINQYGTAMLTKECESYSGLLDAFYSKKDQMERMKQRSSDLLKVLANTSDRITKRLALQKEELKECGNREQLRIKGDLLNANLYALTKGEKTAKVKDLYDPECRDIEIELDVRLTPSQNAQRYYSLYRKADTAEKMLIRLIKSGEEELEYIDSVFDALTRADSEASLDAIRQELTAGGYVRPNKNSKVKREAALPPLRYLSTDGYTILCGRNNFQNDKLTLKDAKNYDIWLHVQKIPGSHTIVFSDGKEVPPSTIEQACIIAAYNSKARDSAKVPVDFTIVKNVKKPNGSKPGMVIYSNYQTVIIDPDENIVSKLLQKQ